MFSATLRSHRSWCKAVHSLRTDSALRLQERDLDGHDIALCVPNSNLHGGGGSSSGLSAVARNRIFRFLLLSAKDIPYGGDSESSTSRGAAAATVRAITALTTATALGTRAAGCVTNTTSTANQAPITHSSASKANKGKVTAEEEARLQEKLSRLLSLTGGVDIGIILLLHCDHELKASNGGDGGVGNVGDVGGVKRNKTADQGGMAAMMKLQVLLHEMNPTPIPLLPLPTVSHLPSLLNTFLSSLSPSASASASLPARATTTTRTTAAASAIGSTNTIASLLQHNMRHRLGEQSINVLSDLFGDNDIARLARACVTSDGRALLHEWLEAEDARVVIAFFASDGGLE